MNRSEFQASLLATYISGEKLEYNEENVPARPTFTRHDPINKLLLAANLYTTEVHIDLSFANIEKLFFCIRVPPQNLAAGQAYQFCDFPAIKMISRIEYYFNSYQNPIESYTTSSLYMQLFESLGSDESWLQYVQDNLGGFDNSQVQGPCSIPESVWVVPIPLSILPLKTNDFGDEHSDNRIFVRIVLNSLRSIVHSSANFVPADFIRTSGVQSNGANMPITSECYIFTQSSESILGGTHNDKRADQQQDYRSNQTWYTQAFSKSVTPKSEYFYAGNNNLLNELTLFPSNPMFSSGRLFYGAYSMNALVNFINTCVYNWNVLFQPATDVLLNLRTGATINLPVGWSISAINSTTYLFTTSSGIKILFVCIGIDWATLPEDVFFDLRAFVSNSNNIPIMLLKNMFFYVKQAAVEHITLTGALVDGNAGFVEGLYLTQNSQMAIYGVQQVDFVDALDEASRVYLRVALSTPVNSGNPLMNVFSKGKLIILNDPLFQHFDLDKTLRIGCNALTTRYADLETYNDSLTQYSWADMFFQDFAAKTKFSTNNLRAMFRFMPSNMFTYNTRKHPNGFLDCVTNTLEIQFNIGIYDALTNRELNLDLTSSQISNQSLGTLIQNAYGSTVINYEFVFKILRFAAYKRRALEFFTANSELVGQIMTKFFKSTSERQSLARALSDYISSNKNVVQDKERRQQKRVRMV